MFKIILKYRGNLPSTDVCNVYIDFVFRFWSFKLFHFMCAKILLSGGGQGPCNLNTADVKHFGKSILVALVLPGGNYLSILPLLLANFQESRMPHPSRVVGFVFYCFTS